MSRRVRYHVAVSLDGFIAGPNGEYDWIVMDPSIDFAALYKEFDTVVMGRKTYEVTTATGGHGAMPGLDVVVFSRTLPAATYPGVRILNDNPRQVVAALKAKRGPRASHSVHQVRQESQEEDCAQSQQERSPHRGSAQAKTGRVV